MSVFCESGLDYCESEKRSLSRFPSTASYVEDIPSKRAPKIGSLIRDNLVKKISNPIMTGLGYDGDVEGVDIEPSKEE